MLTTLPKLCSNHQHWQSNHQKTTEQSRKLLSHIAHCLGPRPSARCSNDQKACEAQCLKRSFYLALLWKISRRSATSFVWFACSLVRHQWSSFLSQIRAVLQPLAHLQIKWTFGSRMGISDSIWFYQVSILKFANAVLISSLSSTPVETSCCLSNTAPHSVWTLGRDRITLKTSKTLWCHWLHWGPRGTTNSVLWTWGNTS